MSLVGEETQGWKIGIDVITLQIPQLEDDKSPNKVL